jgi:DNA repair exonuclease SbcCD nuclease subunit
MLHGGVTKFFEFNCEFELDTIPEGFDYYAMGHIHKRITDTFKNGIMAYPGSTDIKDKGEIQEYKNNGKGYTLLTIDEDIQTEYVNFELERKFIVKDIKYYELDEKIEELFEKIENLLLKRTKKPVLLLNIKEGNFDRSDVSTKIYDKLGPLSLTIRLSYEPTEIDVSVPEVQERLSPRVALTNRIKEELGEEFEGLGYDLYKQLSKQNIQGAQEISDSFYDEHYNVKEGEEK